AGVGRGRSREGGARGPGLGRERGDGGAAGGGVRPLEGGARGAGTERPRRDLRRDDPPDGEERRRQAPPVERREGGGGLVEPSEEDEPPRRDQPRVDGIQMIAVRRRPGTRRLERARRPGPIRHGGRDLRLGDGAARPRDLLVALEAARRAPKELARPRVLTELRHRDPAQRQRRRVVPQRHVLERGERVAGGERAGSGGDEGGHLRTPYPAAPIRAALVPPRLRGRAASLGHALPSHARVHSHSCGPPFAEVSDVHRGLPDRARLRRRVRERRRADPPRRSPARGDRRRRQRRFLAVAICVSNAVRRSNAVNERAIYCFWALAFWASALFSSSFAAMLTWTRRFWVRPASVELSATGRVSP